MTRLSVVWSGPVGITGSGLNFDNQPPSSANADVLFNPVVGALRSADATAMAVWPQARAPAAAECRLWVTTHPSSSIGSVTAGMQICLQTVQGRFVILHVQGTNPELDAQATVWQQQ